jgi:dihydrofolate reductase
MWPFLMSWFERADALLLGRRTWEIWEPHWPHHDDNQLGHIINVLPKYVPSTTLTNPTWQNTHVISDDVEARIRELKAKPGRELQVHGSGVLLRWLLERDLVDELNLRITPVIVGEGLRLFPGLRSFSRAGFTNVEVLLWPRTVEALEAMAPVFDLMKA